VLNALQVRGALGVPGARRFAEHAHREPVVGGAPLGERRGEAGHGVGDLAVGGGRELPARPALLDGLLQARQAVGDQGTYIGDVPERR
jgi:hypothetical protein